MAFRWVALSGAGLVLSVSNVVAAQALTSNTVVHGTLIAGQVQSYTFSADLRNTVYLSCVESSAGSILTPRITVLDPTLTLKAEQSDPERAFVSLQAATIGTYTVRIDSPGLGSGDYDLYFVQDPGPSKLGSLVNDGVVHETIARGDIDTFTATANDREVVELSVVSTSSSSSLHPKMWISNPDDGRFLATNIGGTGERGFFRFRAGQDGHFGDYAIVITDPGGNGSAPLGAGDYDLYFARIPGANEGGLLSNDRGTVTGTIDRGDIDRVRRRRSTSACSQGSA